MINVFSTRQIKRAEAVAIDGGVSVDELIERAASRVFKHFAAIAEKSTRTAVLAGGGNNGADGLSFARLAIQSGYNVTVFLMTESRNVYAEKRVKLLAETGADIREVKLLSDIDFRSEIFIDAIFGIGCARPITGLLLDVIKHINSLRKTVISVDMPSGLNADTGYAEGAAVIASQTVTFGSFKLGQIIGDGRNCCGKLSLYPIGINPADEAAAQIADDEFVKLPKRVTVSHKGSYGRVKIIAGNPEMIGGALLAHESAIAALRSGAGYATLCVPKSLAAAYQCRALEETLYLMPDKKGMLIYDEAALDEISDKAAAVVIGPGLGDNPEIIKIIKHLAGKDIALIIDADGLNALARDLGAVAGHKCRLILTPHAGEFKRLTEGKEFESCVIAVKTLAAELDAVVVMKNATTIISDGESVYLNITGTPAMAKAGSGDVLSGMIGAFAANDDPLHAAVSACWYFGKAGERAAKEKGEYSVLASDIILKI